MEKEKCLRSFPLILMHQTLGYTVTIDKHLKMMETIIKNNDNIDIRFLSHIKYPGVVSEGVKQHQASDRLIIDFARGFPVSIFAKISKMIELSNPGRTIMIIVSAFIAPIVLKAIIAEKAIKEKEIDLVVVVTEAGMKDGNTSETIINAELLCILTEVVKRSDKVCQMPFYFILYDDIYCMLEKYGYDYDEWDDDPLFEDWPDKPMLRQTLDSIMRQPYFQDLSIYYRGMTCNE